MNNHIQQSTDSQLLTTLNETLDSTSSESISSPDSIIPSTSDKRSIDENDEPHISKRLRSSSITTVVKWIPPSEELVIHLQSQSSSLYQFTSSLVNTILPSTDNDLTDEHSRWLHSTLNLYGHTDNNEKINCLIETACKSRKNKSCQINSKD